MSTFPTLPRLLQRRLRSDAAEPPASLASAGHKRVFVVDDDVAHADSLVALLSGAGYQVTARNSGEAGLELIRAGAPDVLILDLNMPGMDGVDVLRELSTMTLPTKTIVFTGTQDFELVAQIVRLGAYDFLTKPSPPTQLLAAVRRATELADLEAENERNRQAAEQANALREFLVEATLDFVYVLDANGKFTYLNNKLEHLFNRAGNNLQGQPWFHLFGTRQPSEALAHHIAEQRTGKRSTREYEFEITLEDGSPRHLLCTSTGLYRSQPPARSGFLGTYGVIRDVTNQKQTEQARLDMERQLQEIGKMEALGQLAGGIAHDFNNILAGMLGYAELVQSAHDRLAPELLKEYLGEVVDAGHRAKDLIAQMQTFTRTNRSAPDAVDLVGCINSVSRMLRAAIPSTISLLTDYEDDLPPALADPVQLQQIVLNLLINARDAIGTKGVIELRVAYQREPVTCSVCGEVLTEPHLVLSVTDTGHGIPLAIRRKIFEMHFTTKVTDSGHLGNVPGSGSGIGLWLINSLVHDYGGHITLDSAVGRGTTFSVHLPIATGGGLGADETAAGPAFKGEVVVVDDIVSVSSFIGELLRARGYDAVVFSDSQAALAHLLDPARHIAMLITDQSMPGLNGLDLIEGVRADRPELPAILITALSSGEHRQRMEALKVNALLPKPFRAADLLALMAEHAPPGG
ncbi:MAG: response regulator [Pseudomonadota bacterium]